MSASVTVNIRGPKYEKDLLSRFQCTYPPSPPRRRKSVASIFWRAWWLLNGSRSHCHRKYSHHISTCATNGACLSPSAGLPYCPRLKLYMKRSYVALLKVQLTPIFVAQPVGSPSLIPGKCAARRGWVRKGVMPSARAPAI